MTAIALKLEMLFLTLLWRTLQHAALVPSAHSPMAAMVANHLVLGTGSPRLVFPLVLISMTLVKELLANHILCNHVLIMLTLQLVWFLVLLSHLTRPQNVLALALKLLMEPLTATINSLLKPLIA